ncbi:MAG: HDOD domain-containing protein [bacterium]
MIEDLRSVQQRLNKNRNLKRILTHENLPVLPELLSKLEMTLRDPKTDSSRVTRLIENEPVIAGRLLKVANSVLYGGRQKITDLQMAVSRIGLNTIRHMVYSLVLPHLFIDIHMVDHRQFWKHSLAAANICRKLAVEKMQDPHSEELAYLAGLVHDVGILLLAIGLTEEYTEIIQTAFSEGRPLNEVEYEVWGLTHADVGAIFITENWELDERIAEALLQFEQAPDLTPRNPLAEALYVADSLCIAAGLTNGALGDPKLQYPEPLKRMEELGYSEGTVEALMNIITELAGSLEHFLI